MKKFQFFLEEQAFGVCTRLGEILQLPSEVIRMYFVYASFLTLGSPIIVYLSLAFWMNMSRYMRSNSRLREQL